VDMTTTDATTANDTSQNGAGVRVVAMKRAPLKELLNKETSRTCSNAPMIAFFWLHILAMVSLIIYVMTHDANDSTSVHLGGLTDFLAGSDTGRKLLGVMIGTCLTGGAFAVAWIWFLRCFKDNSIKVSVGVAHLIVIILCILWFTAGAGNLAAIYIFWTVVIDIWLYYNRKDFPFSEVMMKIATKCVSENPKMLMFAYAFMPLQVFTYIFWLLGLLFCFAFEWGIDYALLIVIVFLFSYVWTGWFWHLLVHSFVVVMAAFWALGMEGGYNKASESCKASMTYSQGPIAIGSFIMACLSILNAVVRNSLRALGCVGWFIYRTCCACLTRIIRRYNEYVLAITSLYDYGFFEASATLVKLFQRTGLSVVTNEVAWSVPLFVGKFCGYCACGGLGLGYHKLAFGDDMRFDLDITFFILYALLGGSVTSIGLAPLQSTVTAIFVIWAEEPASLAAGQPELYGDLLVAVDKSEGVKAVIDDSLLKGNMQVEV